MDAQPFGPGAPNRPALRDCSASLLLLVIAGLLFFARLDSPLLEPEDAFYAEIPRQMLAGDQWLVPTHDGRPYLEKPPLLFWLIMACYGTFGVHDWAARIVPGFAGLGIILVTFWWGRRLLGFRAGLAGALMLCLSVRFIHQTRMISMDGLLCFWILSGLALGQQALQSGKLRWRLWLLSALACGLGMLTKGPVAIILVTVPLMGYQILNRQAARPRISSWLAYLAAALSLPLPWFLAVAWRMPDFAQQLLWNHHVHLRFVQPMHEQPWWYYLPLLFLGMLPWAFLVPGTIKQLIRTGKSKVPAEVWFLLLCTSWCVLFFSLAPCKRIGYMVPAMPTLALFLGYALDKRLPAGTAWGFLQRGNESLAYWATHAVLAAATVTALAAGIAELIGTATCIALVALGLSGIAWLILRTRRQAHELPLPGLGLAGSWAGCAIVTFTFLLLCVHILLPGYYRKFSLRAQAQSFHDADPAIPVICHPHHCNSVSFYLGRREVRSYSRDERERLIIDLQCRPETIVFVKTGSVLDDFLSVLPDSLEFVPKGRASWMTAGLVRQRTATAALRP